MDFTRAPAFAVFQIVRNVTGPLIALITHITLQPELIVKTSRDADRPVRIFEKAEKHCLSANSIKTETTLEPQVNCEI